MRCRKAVWYRFSISATIGDPACRPFIAEIEVASKSEKDQKELELAKNVRQADLKQLLARIENDFSTLKARCASEDTQAMQTAKDMKYMRERQMMLCSQV